MTKCARCCLRNSIRIVNLMMLLCGTGIIIYSLWLEKKWDQGIAKFPHRQSPLTPWFIFTFLGVGIVVCLSTVGGHIIANCISNSTLLFYIVAICCLLSLEATMVVAIFFKTSWGKNSLKSSLILYAIYMIPEPTFESPYDAQMLFKISAYTGEKNTCFEMFILIHVKISCAITILILVAQSSVVILAAILWAVGREPRTDFLEVDTSVFIQSFLVPAESPGFAERPGQACRGCGTSLPLGGGNAPRSFLSRFKSLLRRRSQRTYTVY